MSRKEKKNLKHPFLLLIAVILVGIIIALPFFIPSLLDSNYVKQELSQLILEKTGTKIDAKKIELRFFPRPFLKIDHIKIALQLQKVNEGHSKKQSDHANLIIDTALFYPDLKALIHGRGKNLSGTLIIEKARIPDLTDTGISLTHTVKALSIDYLKINLKRNLRENFKADITGEHPQLFLKNTQGRTLSGKKFTANINVLNGKTQIYLDMFALNFPSMDISINFFNDKNQKKSLLEISGKNANIDEIRQTAMILLKGNEISHEIFRIIRSGIADRINVSFHGRDLKTLFYAKNMVIEGRISHGSIGIPETRIVTTETTGKALVKKGILYTDIQKGHIGNSTFQKASLNVSILNHKHPFKGTFPINADLKDLSDILKELLLKSPVERELSLCKNIKGRAKGILVLTKKDSSHISVSVHAHDILLETEYQRLPGKIFITGGNFIYEDGSFISVDNLSGHIGKHQFSDLYASIGLTKNHPIEIKSGKALIVLKDVFPWLMSFKKINSALFPLKSAAGAINIDSIDLKGPVLVPGQWHYKITGSCRNIHLGTDLFPGEISSAAGDFKISDRKILLSNLDANILKTNLLTHVFYRTSPKFGQNSGIKTPELKSSALTETSLTNLINDIALPLSISKTNILLSTEGAKTFQGDLLFKTGSVLYLSMNSRNSVQRDSGLDILSDTQDLKRSSNFKLLVQIKDKKRSHATISYTKRKNAVLHMKGILNTKTIEKILKKGSGTAKALSSFTGGSDFTISADKKSGIIVSTDTIDLNTWIKKLKSKKPNSKFIYSSLLPRDFSVKANSLTFKTFEFTPFEAKAAIDKNGWTLLIENTKFCDINITGIINKKNKDNALNLSAAFFNKKGDLDSSMPCIFKKADLVKGGYSITGDFSSRDSMDHIFDNLHGQCIFHSSEGRIYKLTLLSRILSVINISKFIKGGLPNITQDGFAYNSIDIKADVKKNRVFLNSAVIRGVDMTLTFNGWMDLSKGTSDITCLVSPFRTADMVIKHIPLLGHILKGQLVSIPVEITGKLNDPKVFLLPPSKVGRGLINIMERTLETPFRIIKLIP